MNPSTFPKNEILQVLKTETYSDKAFEKILSIGRKTISTEIWNHFKGMDLNKETKAITKWIQTSIDIKNAFSMITFSISSSLNEQDNFTVYLGLYKEKYLNTTRDIALHAYYPFDESFVHNDWFLCTGLQKGLVPMAKDGSLTKAQIEQIRSILILGYGGIILTDALIAIGCEHPFVSVLGWNNQDQILLVEKRKKGTQIKAEILPEPEWDDLYDHQPGF